MESQSMRTEPQTRDMLKFCNENVTNVHGEKWDETTRLNYPLMHQSVWKLSGIYDGNNEKAMILVGASPELKIAMPELKKLDRKHFAIICSNSALKPLLKAEIIPDYVIAIDVSDVIVQHLEGIDTSNLTLLRTSNSAHGIKDVWKGEVYWVPYYGNPDKKLCKKVKRKLGDPIATGGNSLATALTISILVFGCKMVVFVATPFCLGNKYYADEKNVYKPEGWKDGFNQFHVYDVKGRRRYTNMAFYQYKTWIEMQSAPLRSHGVLLIDTSEGLLGTEGEIISMPLKEAVTHIEGAFKFKEQDHTWDEIEKVRYNAAYNTQCYDPKIGKFFWNGLRGTASFENINNMLDVGCGKGEVVKLAREDGIESYGIDIAEKAEIYWQQNGVDQFCIPAGAHNIPYPDNHFDLVTCFDVLEHIPEEGIMDTLKEIHRIGSHDFVFTIALNEATHKMPHDGSEPHRCVHDDKWWRDQLFNAGFRTGISEVTHHGESGGYSLVIFTLKDWKDDDNPMRASDMLLVEREVLHKGENRFSLVGGLEPSECTD